MSERPDIDAAVEQLPTKIGVKKAVKRLPEIVPKTERIEVLLGGNYSNGFGLLVLTDQRLFFFQESWTQNKQEDFSFDHISSIQLLESGFSGTIILSMSGGKAEIKSVSITHAKVMISAIRTHLTSLHATPTTSDSNSPVELLSKLSVLRDAGILTEAEFSTKKTEIFARM